MILQRFLVSLTVIFLFVFSFREYLYTPQSIPTLYSSVKVRTPSQTLWHKKTDMVSFQSRINYHIEYGHWIWNTRLFIFQHNHKLMHPTELLTEKHFIHQIFVCSSSSKSVYPECGFALMILRSKRRWIEQLSNLGTK